MTEHATTEFKRRFARLPHPVRDSLSAIAKSSLSDEVEVDQHRMLLETLISVVDADYGEDVRVEMGWCLERMDDVPIAEWVAKQA